MRKIERELQREFPFAKLEIANSSHYRLRLPNGRVVLVSSTPSCPRFMENVRADVRRRMKKESHRGGRS